LWALSGAIIGIPLVVVMPALAALSLIVLGVGSVVALARGSRNGTTLVATCVGLAIPVLLYFGLAMTRS
jgi:hypothetical protein